MQSNYSLPSHVFQISSQHPPPCQPQRVFPPPLPMMMRALGYTSRSVRLTTCGQEYRVLVRLSSDQQLALLTFDISAARATRNRSRGGGQDESQQKPTRDFVSRMSLFPLVGTALRAYEQGKAASIVVKVRLLRHVIQSADNYMQKYGAQMVESGMKTISKPVIDRLPVNQIDEFACRQLDRVSYCLINIECLFAPTAIGLILSSHHCYKHVKLTPFQCVSCLLTPDFIFYPLA